MSPENEVKYKELKSKKEDAISTARDLVYPEEIISKIRSANSEGEIYRLMHTARMG